MRRHFSKIIIRIIIGVVAFIAIAIIALMIGAEKIINNNLSDFVFEKTDSIYRLEFEGFDINLKNRSVSFSNVVLQPDTLAISESPEKYYSFQTDTLVVRGIKIIDLYRLRKFSAESIIINAPTFRLSSGQDVDMSTFATQKIGKGDTVDLRFLKEIEIDTILITNARMKIDTLAFPGRKTPRVNLEILDLRMGGIKKTNTPFPFDVADISLKVENLDQNLPDKIHRLFVSELSLSLLYSTVAAKGIVLEPINETIKTTENRYRIEVPKAEIISSQLENFLQADTIPIEKLTFYSPSIEIKFGSKIQKGTPLNEINLYKLIEGDLAEISIGQFSISNASLKLIPTQTDVASQSLENVNINFYDFRINKNSYADKDRILSSKDLDISIEKYALNHVDKVHQLVINNFNIDTKSKKVSTGNITFKPINTSNKLLANIDALIDVSCKNATLTGVNFYEVYHKQKLPMDNLLIESPVAVISLAEQKKKKKQVGNDVSLIYQKTKDYMKGIYVKNTIIDKGELNYNYLASENKSGFFMTKFRFELNKLSIDSMTFYKSDKIFFANDFDVKFSDIALQLADGFHRLKTDSVILSSRGQAADIYNLKILPIQATTSIDSLFAKGQQEVFDMSFPKIELHQADLHKAFFEKELSISEFNVVNPIINIDWLGDFKLEKTKNEETDNDAYSLISDYLFKINIEKMRMKNGQLNISQYRKNQPPVTFSNAFSVEMTRFEIDEKSATRKHKILYADNIDLILKNQTFSLADGVHKVDAEEIGILSSKNQIYINKATVYPDVAADSFDKLSITAMATIPSVQINGANIHRLFNEKQLSVNTIELSKPDIKLLFHSNNSQKNEKKQSPQFSIEGFNEFTVNQFIIRNGSIEIASYENQKSKTIATSLINFTLDGLSVKNQGKALQTSYNDFGLSMKNTAITLPPKSQQIGIKQVQYQLSEKKLTIANLSFKPKNNTPNKGETLVTVGIPSLVINGFNFVDFLEKKEIIADFLATNSPIVEIISNENSEKKGFDPYSVAIYPEIKSFINKMNITRFEVTNATLKINNGKESRFDNLNLYGESFFVDENSLKNKKFLSCNNMRMETTGVKGKSSKGFYNYNIEKIALSSNGNFSATGITLKPAYPEAEFNRRKVFQEDYITLHRTNCKGSGLDLQRFFLDNEIVLKKVNFDIEKAEIYRNNHYPANPDLILDMPQKSIRDIKAQFIADSISIFCNRFNYRELEPQASTETQLFFTNIDANITHLTNIKKLLQKNPESTLAINTKLMGVGEMNATLKLNVLSPDNKFTMKAECGPMPLNLLNSITEPSLKLSIKEGRNEKIDLYFEADEDSARGEMSFAYNDLKISLLSDKGGTVREEKFISFLLNSLALKSDNPRNGKKIIPVPANARRDERRSFVNYCWRSTFTGIKNTFGLKDEEKEP